MIRIIGTRFLISNIIPVKVLLRSLSLMAANKGTNLKRLIEGLLDKVAEDYDDSKAYAWLVENRPDGQVFLNENEKKDFENWLGV